MTRFLFYICFITSIQLFAQSPTGIVTGKITTRGQALEFANVQLQGTALGNVSNSEGLFKISNIPFGSYQLIVSAIGYETQTKSITLSSSQPQLILEFAISESVTRLSEIVVSGTMKEVSRLESPVAVEVYSPLFFKANPTPSIFESLQNVNGIRPQLNCNVCNTGDIHINGLEGPYTMIMIDGMPIVSGLSTVYGLTGIPQSLIERVEIVKGPASALYGSEAVGGLINIITKNTASAPLVSIDAFGTSWGESNTDIGIKFKPAIKAHSLLGINYFNYKNPIDNNKDGFTDITLQNRISVFNKWSFDRKDNRIFTIAGRYNYEDRWGGDMKWTPEYRGGDVYYGESIYTKRWEMFGTYQLPVKEIINFQFSGNGHNQNSYYGTMPYFADQFIGFGQFTWSKQAGTRHDLLLGAATRYTFYDDNTPATSKANGLTNAPSLTFLPGIFIQDEIKLDEQNKLLLGARYDFNSLHGSIFSPRLNYKWNSLNKKNTVRVSAGNGYRVANVFTEDHAALTGARQVIFTEALLPETSWNGNINVVKNFYIANSAYLSLDATAFYTFFNNRIVPDYETDPNKIIYDNLDGSAVSQGISLNTDVSFQSGLKILAGGTLMNVTLTENGQTIRQLLTERFSGVWNIGYTFGQSGFSIDYTGNLYGPMRLPLLSELDNRTPYSPWWSVQNIQITKRFNKGWEAYGGVKNLLNYTPPSNSIARPFDPFDRNVQLDGNGKVIPTADNPYALTFDPSYVFAPNQGTRVFVGLRFTINK
jgi:outer membrane receptor for ferrienterochelin and colicins